MIIIWGKFLHGKTQKQNESLNAMIWNRVPKGTYVGLQQLEIGVYDAVSHFNIGNKAVILVCEKLVMVAGNNRFRIENSRPKTIEDKKNRRRNIKGCRKAGKKIKSTLLKGRHTVLVHFDMFGMLQCNLFIVHSEK